MIRFKIFTYIFIILVFTLFTLNYLESIQNLNISNFEYLKIMILSLVPSIIIITFTNIIRYYTSNTLEYIGRAITLFKGITYFINILIFTLWVFILSYLTTIYGGVDVFSGEMVEFFLTRLGLSIVFGLLTNWFMVGMTAIKRKQ